MSKKIILMLLGILLVTFGWYSFGSADNKRQEETIRIGYIPIADSAQIYIAQEKGFFHAVGLNVEFIKFSGGAKILEALASDSIDIGFSNVVSLILANKAGLNFKAITGGSRADLQHKFSGLMTLSSSNINTLKDLEGKTIAINTKKNIVELLLKKYLEKNEVDIHKIKFIEMAFPRMQQVLEGHHVDAIATVEPFVTFGLKSDKTKLLGHYFTGVLDSLEIGTYNAKEDWIQKHKSIYKKFRKAIFKATAYMVNNPDDLKLSIAKYTKLNTEQVQSITLPNYGANVNIQSLEAVKNILIQNKWINGDINTAQLKYDK